MPLTIPQYIEIKTAAGATAAYLSPEADGLKDVYIDRELNGKSTLTFSLPILPGGADVPVLTVKGVMPTIDVADPNSKWQYLTDQYRIYAGGREFVILNPDAIEKVRDGKKLWGKVTAHESWVLLGKKYVTVSNDPQTPNPPALAVIILSGGSDLSGGRYPVGSAGHALYAILQGTGWSVGTVDVEGIHDLETEKLSVLENINKIQEIWGGYLVWDSINKTVSLRSETAWAPYTGYQVRYAKNLKGITRTDDYDIITKLYPFGENDLNIASVNNGQLYIENYSYTSEVLEGIWVNQDIADPQKLKDEATKYLEKVCRPRHNYRIDQVDLRTLSGYQHEDFDLGHLADVIDEDLGVNTKVRIIGYKYNVFQPWQCELEVGDPIEKIESMLVDSIKTVKYLNSIKNSKGELFTPIHLVDESITRQKIAKAAIDATRLDTKTVILLEDVWTSNNPSPGYVSWNQHKLYYAGKEYVIQAGNTNQKYIYWDGSSNSYSTSATEPELAEGQFFIAVNNGGLHDIIWNKGYGRQFIGSAFIADAAIKEAHIADLAVTDAKIANITANKITSGQILAYLVEILGQNGYFKLVGDGLRVYNETGQLIGHFGWYETPSDQTATFTRSSVAYTSTGQQVAANVPRYEAGQFGSGILVEEGTTNLLMADQASVEGTLPGGYVAAGSGTVARSTERALHGSASIKVVAGTGAFDGIDLWNGAIGTGFPVTPGETYTFSYWASGGAGGEQIILEVYRTDWTWIADGTVITLSAGGWVRATITFTVPTGVTSVIFVARKANNAAVQTWYMDCLQLERKAYASSWQLPDTARSPETLTIPTAGVLNPQEGTIEGWFYLNDTNSAHYSPLFTTAYVAAPGPRLLIMRELGSGKLAVWDGDGTSESFYTGTTVIQPKTWYHFAFTWSSTGRKLYLNGVLCATDTRTTPIGMSDNAKIGSCGEHYLNGFIDDLRISSRARTDEEILAAYQSGQPLPVDEWTTWKSSFDGHLYNEVPIRKYGLMLKQGTIKLEAPAPDEGIQIYDAQGNLRTHIGQYAPGKYGAKVINGEIYSTSINSGMPGDVNRIELSAGFMPLTVYYNNKEALNMYAVEDGGYLRILNPTRNIPVGWLLGFDDIRGVGLALEGFTGSGWGQVYIVANPLYLQADYMNLEPRAASKTDVTIWGDLHVTGNMSAGGSKPARQVTQNYGERYLYARESPDVRYIIEGKAQLVNGECKIDLDPIFLECVEPNSDTTPWLVHITPMADIRPYVAEIGATYIIVKEATGMSNDTFFWSLSCIRKGYAGTWLEQAPSYEEVLTSNWEDNLGV